jgi:hypothetical protein
VTARIARIPAAALAAAALSLALAAAPEAHAGVRVVAPAPDAVRPAGPVRVALAVRDARLLDVTVDGASIAGRLRRQGRRRVAMLRPGAGAHRLAVTFRPDGARRTRTIERRFMVARRQAGLAWKVAPKRAVASAAGVVKLRIGLRRGVGLVHAWVNGRRVRVPHVGRLWPETTLRLGARHRLRFGRNRIRVLAHDYRDTAYDVETWTVRVRRTRPLAAGIAVHHGEAGGRAVRLDGRGARPTRAGRRLSWRWRVVRRPRGSRAKLRGASTATPRLKVDVRGRYTLVQRVRERGGRSTAQRVTVLGDTNAPPLGASLSVHLDPGRGAVNNAQIVVDDAPTRGLPARDCRNGSPPGAQRCVYPLPNPYYEVAMLVLDAVTLEPRDFVSVEVCTYESALDGEIGHWAGKNVIAIVTSAAACGRDYVNLHLDITQPFTYVFTPSSKPDMGVRSGWYSESNDEKTEPAEISGFFQKTYPVGAQGPSHQYQFVPGDYVAYDTSKAGAAAGQNTMVVGANQYTSALPAGASDGFQVLALDKTLTPVLGTPRTFSSGPQLADMANLLRSARTTRGVSTVLVQSIGRPSPATVSADDAWNALAGEIGNLGGNSDVLLTLPGHDWKQPPGAGGWYSLATSPGSSPVAEASSPLTGRDGDLGGILGRNTRWQYEPLMEEAGGEAGGEMLTLAYQQPQQWPFTDAQSRPVLDYLASYDQGATDLRPLQQTSCYDPGDTPDVRSSYCSITVDWDGMNRGLGDSKLGQGVCARYPGTPAVKVDQAQYEAICDRISRETAWLAAVKQDMLQMKAEALGDQALTAYMAVSGMADQAKADVESGQAKPNRNVTAEALEMTGESLELISLFMPEPIGAVGEVFAGTLALAGEVTSLDEGDEQGESAVGQPFTVPPDKVGEEMEDRLNTAGLAFDHAWDMIVSDPAKLEEAYNRFSLKGGVWDGVADDLDRTRPWIQNGVRHWAAGEFMAATYDVWLVDTSQIRGEQTRDVGPSDVQTIGCDRQYSWGNTSTWSAFNRLPPEAAYYWRDRLGMTQPKLPSPVPRYGSNIWVLGQGNVMQKGATRYWPPAPLMEKLLTAPGVQDKKPTGGYGWERPWLFTRGPRFNVQQSASWVAQKCFWFAQDRYPQ